MQNRLMRVQPAQFVEPLAALVEREQAALAEGLGLQFPEHPGLEPAVAHEREGEGILGLQPGQAGGGVEHARKLMPLGQFAGFDGRAACDRLQLGPVRQVVVDHDEQAFELGRQVHAPAPG